MELLEFIALYEEINSLSVYCRAQRGKQLSLTIRFSNQGRSFDDTDVWTHANDTLGSVRRQILTRFVRIVLHILHVFQNNFMK